MSHKYTTHPKQLHTSNRCVVYTTVCCSVLQCVAVCCSVLQCVAGGHKAQNTLRHPQRTATRCNTLHHICAHCYTRGGGIIMTNLQSYATCNYLQHIATHCNTLIMTNLQSYATCNNLQHIATHYNSLHPITTPSTRISTTCTSHCNVVQCVAAHCNTYSVLQHTATRRQHGATHFTLFLCIQVSFV